MLHISIIIDEVDANPRIFISMSRCAVKESPPTGTHGRPFPSGRSWISSYLEASLVSWLCFSSAELTTVGVLSLLVTWWREEEQDHSLNTRDTFLKMLYWRGGRGGVLIMQAICLQPGFRIWMTISPPYYTAWLNTCFWLVKQGVGLLFLYSRLMLRTTDRYYGRYSNSNRHNQFKSILNK